MNQSVAEWKQEGLQCLQEYKSLLNKNEHTREQLDRMHYIENKFGEHIMFKQAVKDNYDARANSGWGGFGAPNCYCHVAPPCENCIAWTNTCKKRDGADKGCMQVGHDCEMAEEYGYDKLKGENLL